MTTREEKIVLLRVAREAIRSRLERRPLPILERERIPPSLWRPGASFVTLTIDGRLRGCIGSLQAYRPLVEDVQQNAIAAAFHDPRFPPLTPQDFARVLIEISILSAPRPLAFESPEALVRKLRPGVDGVVLHYRGRRATFLPQVWEQLPDPIDFLGNLAYKAGLPPDAWRWPGVQIETYQVEKFTERELSEP